MDYSELYVQRIRNLCRQRNITINRLATMSGVKQSTLDNIVRGLTKDPRVTTLHKIAHAFNMTLSEFLDFEELNDYIFPDESDDIYCMICCQFFLFPFCAGFGTIGRDLHGILL